MDEVIIIRPSTRYVMLRVLGTLFVVETIYALIFMLYLALRSDQSFDRSFIFGLWFAHTLKFVVLVFLLADVVIRYLGTRYYITKHNLIVSRGIVTDDEKVYELEHIRKVSGFQDPLGKRMNYGSINLLLGARGFEEHITLAYIANPHSVIKEIEKHIAVVAQPNSQ